MSSLISALVPAVAISALACVCLMRLPNAPPRLRFGVAIVGLCAWLVPWAWLRVPIGLSSAPLGEPFAALAVLGGPLAVPTVDEPWPFVRYLAACLFVIGAALFAGDWLAMQRCVRRWRAASFCCDALRSELPPELRDVQAEIRVVRGSRVAAASGWLKPTVWIGDGYTGATRQLILVHELWHARQRDPVWVALIAVVRRAYWWNPIVAHLAREALLMLESACDHRCAAGFGKRRYVSALAALALDRPPPSAQLLATVRRENFDVARLRLLDRTLCLRVRDVLLIAGLVLTAGATTAAASVVIEHRVAIVADSTSATIPDTPAGRALEVLLRAVNGGDADLLREYLGAYTPQELPLPFPNGAELRVVDVLTSEPWRIEYVVESHDGRAGIGEIEVADSSMLTIMSSRLRELPASR